MAGSVEYKVAVGVFLTNQVSSILGLIARDFIKTDIQAKRLQGTLREIKLLGAGGLLLGGLGAGGLMLVGKTVDAAKEYAHQLALLNQVGMKHVDIVRAINAAWAASKATPTSSATENLAAIRELRMVFGNTTDAITNVSTVQRIQAILSTLTGGGAAAQDQAYTVAKALEMKGAVRTPGEFNRQADMMTKAIIASGGKITPQDFLSAFKHGRTATVGWSDAFAYTILPTLIQEMKTRGGGGGSATGGPGSALMSAFAAIVGGTISQKALPVWEKLGLLDPHKIVWTRGFGMKGVQPGGVRGSDLFQSDPYQWVNQILIPALHKAGYNDPAKMREALQFLFPNRTAGFIMTQLATQGWKFQRDVPLIRSATGLAGYEQLLKTDPMMAQLALQKQWNNLMAILGFQLMPVLIPLMIQFTTWLNGLATWMKENPGTARTLMFAFTGLSLSLLFSGAVLSLTAAFRALGLLVAIGGPLLSGMGLVTTAMGTTGLLGIVLRLSPALLALAAAAALVYAIAHPVKYTPAKGDIAAHPSYMPDWLYKRGPGWEDVGHFFWNILKPRENAAQFRKTFQDSFYDNSPAAERRHQQEHDDLMSALRAIKDFLLTPTYVLLDGQKVGQLVAGHIVKGAGPAARGPTGTNPGVQRVYP